MTSTQEHLLEVESLQRHFPVRDAFGRRTGSIRALDDVSFRVRRGETFGIVGESGCGKTTLGKTLAGIHAPGAGRINFEGAEIAGLRGSARGAVTQRLQYIHQDPGNALDPRWTIGRSLDEPLKVHTKLGKAERGERVRQILAAVGLPSGHLDLYPHEISGGQQRRVGLARILSLEPRLVILDEPTSGLDVSVQATVLNLLLDLQDEFGMTYVFISHDLAVVKYMADDMLVMNQGAIVERGPADAIYADPQNEYTRKLMDAIPRGFAGRQIRT